MAIIIKIRRGGMEIHIDRVAIATLSSLCLAILHSVITP